MAKKHRLTSLANKFAIQKLCEHCSGIKKCVRNINLCTFLACKL